MSKMAIGKFVLPPKTIGCDKADNWIWYFALMGAYAIGVVFGAVFL